MNLRNNINALKKKGYKFTKKYKSSYFFRKGNNLVILHKDGKYEYFVKNQLQEGNIRHAIEGIILVGLICTYFSTDITIIDGNSMEPTLKNHEVIIKSAVAKNINKIQLRKGSIVKFKSPDGELSIKRIIGMPGDIIKYHGAKVFVNDEFVGESDVNNVNSQEFSLNKKPNKKHELEVRTFKLSEGQYYVIGDNTDWSIDSRKYGPINKSCLISVIEK